jgi:hypothetical protein
MWKITYKICRTQTKYMKEIITVEWEHTWSPSNIFKPNNSILIPYANLLIGHSCNIQNITAASWTPSSCVLQIKQMCNEIVLDRVNFSLTLTFWPVVQFKTISPRFYKVNPAIPPTFKHLDKGTILNLADRPHAFPWIMVILLTLPPFNATLSSEVTHYLIWWAGMSSWWKNQSPKIHFPSQFCHKLSCICSTETNLTALPQH